MRPPADWAAADARLSSFKLLNVGEDLSDDDTSPPSIAEPPPPPPAVRRPSARIFRTGRAVGGNSTPPLPPPADEVTALSALPPPPPAGGGGGEDEDAAAPEEEAALVLDGTLETADGRPSAAALAAHRAAGGHAFVGPVDREQVAAQRRAVWDIVKGLGGRLLRDGLNLTRTSLPVAVFEPRSFVQRVADNWAYLGLLDAAAACPDPAERVRLVTAFILGGLSRQTSTLKPFNPILGETWAAEFVGTGGGGSGGPAAVGEEEGEAAAPSPPPSTPFAAAAAPAAAAKKKPTTPAWMRSLTVRRAGSKAGSASGGGRGGHSTTTPTARLAATPPPGGWTHAGAAVWAEQISHHPPATAWLVESRVGRDGAGGGGGGAEAAATPSQSLLRAASLGGSRRPASPADASTPSPSSSSAPPPGSWTFTGVGTWAAHFRGNSIAGRQAGGNAVFFAGDPARGSPPSSVSWELPPMAMRGIMFGARVLRYTGSVTVADGGHGIVSEVGIGGAPPGPAGEALGAEVRALARRPAEGGGRDGGGLRPDDCVGVLLVNGMPVDTLVGSWLSHADWLGRPPLKTGGGGAGKEGTAGAAPRRLWDATRDAAAAPVPLAGGLANGGLPPPSVAPTPRRAFSRSRSAAATPRAGTGPGLPSAAPASAATTAAALPSDALAREDLVALKAGDPAGSQAWKTRLEERQRAERGWRKAGREAAGMEAAE